MKLMVAISCMLLSFAPANAMAAHSYAAARVRPATLMHGFGQVHHPVSTHNPNAQRFFDQGLALVYGFNHDEAERSFRHAAELDPNLAMAYWGIALAVGPNYNMNVDPAREKAAFDAIQKALALEANASEIEKAYIEAMAKRFSDQPDPDLKALARDYTDAMRELAKRYPEDLDAATLYADALMNLHPWQLWDKDGNPTDGTAETVTVLQSVLDRDPDHLGANHLYIHAVEASPTPELALASAHRLGQLAPAAGHLVHMPSHIYYRIGDFEASVKANEAAARADRAYLRKTHAQGAYPMMYYSHNLHFLVMSYSMEGRFRAAKKSADRLAAHIAPYASDTSMGPEMSAFIQMVLPMPTLVLMRFERWDEVLATPRPAPSSPVTDAFWNFAHGCAYAVKGDLEAAGSEREAFMASVNEIPADAMFGFDKTTDVLKIAAHLLDARIAIARHDTQTAISELRAAVEAQDQLAYAEPPNWYYPVRETLGGVLLANGSYADAEQVFRDDLKRNPDNPRSLFGLRESLKAQGRIDDSRWVDKRFTAAWKNADTKLRVEDL